MAKKKVVQPTEKEQGIIQNRLKGKYRQMYESVPSDMRYLSGIPPELRKNLEKMVTKRLKKVYGGK